MILFVFIFFVYFPVENDPHFIIYLPKSQKNICFNIDSEPGKILNLVSDPELGKIKRYYIRIGLLDHGHSSLSLPGISFFSTLIKSHIYISNYSFQTLIVRNE